MTIIVNNPDSDQKQKMRSALEVNQDDSHNRHLKKFRRMMIRLNSECLLMMPYNGGEDETGVKEEQKVFFSATNIGNFYIK